MQIHIDERKENSKDFFLTFSKGKNDAKEMRYKMYKCYFLFFIMEKNKF